MYITNMVSFSNSKVMNICTSMESNPNIIKTSKNLNNNAQSMIISQLIHSPPINTYSIRVYYLTLDPISIGLKAYQTSFFNLLFNFLGDW